MHVYRKNLQVILIKVFCHLFCILFILAYKCNNNHLQHLNKHLQHLSSWWNLKYQLTSMFLTQNCKSWQLNEFKIFAVVLLVKAYCFVFKIWVMQCLPCSVMLLCKDLTDWPKLPSQVHPLFLRQKAGAHPSFMEQYILFHLFPLHFRTSGSSIHTSNSLFFFPQPQFLTVSYSTRHRLKLSAQITLSVCVSNSAKHLTLISHRLFKCHREKLQSIEMLNPIYIHFNDSDSIIYVVSKICFPNSFECFEHSPLPPQIILQV